MSHGSNNCGRSHSRRWKVVVLVSLVALCVSIAGSCRYRSSYLERHNPRENTDSLKGIVSHTQSSTTHNETYQGRTSNISLLEPTYYTDRGLGSVGKPEEPLYNTGRGLENVGKPEEPMYNTGRGLENVGKPEEPMYNTGRGLENVGKPEEPMYNTGRGLENVGKPEEPKYNTDRRFEDDGKESTGYILVSVYSGQQGSGSRALLSLQCWAASFSLPVHIVEPFVERSTFTFRVESEDTTTLVRFSDFYDIEHFNSISHKDSLPSIVPWENFIQYASKNVIVVTVSHASPSCQDHNGSEVIEDLGDSGQCSYSQEWLLNSRLFAAVDLCVVRVVSLTEHCLFINPQAVRKMYDNIFKGRNPRNTTVLFRSWFATWDRLSSPDPGSQDCKDTDGRKLKYVFHPSGRLLRDAQRYGSMFLKGDHRVAVMIRAEQTVIGASETSQDSFQSMISCLQETVQIARNLMHSKESESSSGIFLTLDIGKYGSKSLEKTLVRKAGQFKIQATYETIMKSVKDIILQLYDRKWTYTEWENSFAEATGGLENPGYIASLQKTIASQADCLVLMGGGDYQRLALAEYLENHRSVSNLCVHFVCLRFELLKQFSRLLDQD